MREASLMKYGLLAEKRSLVFRVAGTAGVSACRGTSSAGSKGGGKRDEKREEERREEIYSIAELRSRKLRSKSASMPGDLQI